MKYAEICWHCQFVLITRRQLKIHSYIHNNTCDVISSYYCPCPCHCLKCLGIPCECIHGEEAASGVKIEWLAIVNLMWWVYCTNAMHTPQIYSDTGEELKSSWGGSNAIWKPLRREKSWFCKVGKWTFVLWSSNINPICIVSLLRIQ